MKYPSYPFPVVYCALCNAVRRVEPDGRGFPPDIAKRKLRKSCKEHGCACDPQYVAGFIAPRAQP